MFRSTDADLIAFDDLGQTFAQVLKLMQAELDVAVYTGTGTVEIRYGPALGTVVGLDTTYTDLDPLNLGPLRELINDLHLSTLLPSWTASHGGALLLRAVFEEEGTEIRGSLDFDLKHMEMQLFLVPGLNAAGEVNWKIETAVEIDGPALIDSMKQTIEDNILASGLTQAISDSLKPVTDILGLLLGLDTSDVVKTRYGAIHISDGVAEFTDPPPGGLRVDVLFDSVSVLEDSDWPGQGELSFSPSVQGVAQSFSEEYAAASGTRVPLVGAHWRVPVVVPAGDALTATLTMKDRENVGKDEVRGTATLTLSYEQLLSELPGPIFSATRSDRGDFDMHTRVLAPGQAGFDPAVARSITVTLAHVQQLRDHDTFGKGEAAYQLLVNDVPSRVSLPYKTAGREDEKFEPRDDAGKILTVTVYPKFEESVRVQVLGWDVDHSQRDSLGTASETFGPGTLFDDTDVHISASSQNFVAIVRMVDNTATTNDGGDGDNGSGDDGTSSTGGSSGTSGGSGSSGSSTRLTRLVILDRVMVNKDGDTFGAGDIVVSATAAAVTEGKDPKVIHFGGGDPLKLGHNATLPLVGEIFRQSVALTTAQKLRVTTRVTDVDGKPDDGDGNDDLLASVSRSFGADSDHGLGTQHLVSDDGEVDVTVRIVDPVETGEIDATVRFENYRILRDHTALAPGKFWARAFVNGYPLDDGEKVNTEGGDDDTADHAGRGDLVILDIRDWQREVHIAPGGEVEVEFEVFEARDNDHTSLGRVTQRFAEPFDDRLITLTPESGDYDVSLRVMPPPASKRNQVRITFLEVQVLDDGDIWSEGELYFLGAANTARTPQSPIAKARRRELIALTGAEWQLVCGVDVGDRLDISFTMFDEDRDTLQSLGVALASFNHAGKWGLGEHLLTAAGNAFRVRFVIEPLTEDSIPDLPGVVARLVQFRSVEVIDDGDWADNGEISFTASVNGTEVLASSEYKVGSGDTVFLPTTSASTGYRVWLAPEDALAISFNAIERDNSKTHSLGLVSSVLHGPEWGGDALQGIDAPSGNYRLEFQVLNPVNLSNLVKFQHVQILGDREAIGRGEMSFEGRVNGLSGGESARMKAGRDGNSPRDDLKSLIFLGGPRWARRTQSAEGADSQSIDIEFDGWEHDATGRKKLGRVSARIDIGAGWPEPFTAAPAGDVAEDVSNARLAGQFVRPFTFEADTGKFRLTLLVEKAIPTALLSL